MKCEEAMEAMADRATGDLDAAGVETLRRHLEECPGCAAEATALQAMWDGLATPLEDTPSTELRRRFDDLVQRELVAGREAGARRELVTGREMTSGRENAAEWVRVPVELHRRRSPQPVLLGLALAATLALTLGAGVYIGSTTAERRDAGDIAELRSEIHSLRSTVALALLSEPSASERLSGVAYGRELQTEDRRVADALFERLLEDPNVNVRLAALDALREVAARPETQKRLLASIREQDSPLVQISAIDVLLEDAAGPQATAPAGGADSARADLAQLASDPALDEVVRGYLRDRLERSSR